MYVGQQFTKLTYTLRNLIYPFPVFNSGDNSRSDGQLSLQRTLQQKIVHPQAVIRASVEAHVHRTRELRFVRRHPSIRP